MLCCRASCAGGLVPARLLCCLGQGCGWGVLCWVAGSDVLGAQDDLMRRGMPPSLAGLPQVFGVLATLSLISLRATQAANFELGQKLLEAGRNPLLLRAAW